MQHNMTSMNSLEALFVDQLKDLYSAEQQLMDALPKMAKASSHADLEKAFNQHLETTRQQAKRLEDIFSNRQEQPGGKKCKGMEGILKEGEEMIQKRSQMDKDVLDAALIASAQRAEHYEISGYGTARTYAKALGHDKTAKMLDKTLDEESKTDEKLTKIAESHINQRAKANSH